jgi:NAD+ diphosphatase
MPEILNPPPHRYADPAFERAALRRKDAAWLAARRRDPRTRVVTLHGLDPVVDGSAAPRLRLTALAELGETLGDDAPFLGEHHGVAVFVRTIDAAHPAAGAAVALRRVGPVLPADEAALAAYARALRYWHDTHGFCSACGGRTRVEEAGHARACGACGRTVFPRTDPAVIVLVACDEHCLLGRSPRLPAGMYSTLAGFVEPGESLEDTVRREIREEAGVDVTGLAYRSSQPWPFPASLMLGFHATAAARTLAFEDDELEDARWFHRRELVDPSSRPVALPAPDSIARWLIESWLYGR